LTESRSGDVSHMARSGAVQILTGLSQSLTVVAHVAAARLFGPLVFGTYQTCAALVEMLVRAGTGGADKGMLRYVAGFHARGEEDQVDAALGTGLRLCWRLGAVLAVLGALAAGWRGGALLGAGVAAMLPVMAPAVLLTGTTLILVQASLALRVVRANLVVRGLGEPLFLLGAVVVALAVGGGPRALGAAHAAAAALVAGLAVVMVGRFFGYRPLLHVVRAPSLPGFAAFTVPLGAAELLNSIYQRADLVILTRFLGGEAAAFYAAAEFVTRAIANVRYAFDSVAAGLFSEALHTGDRARLRESLALMTRWVITATLPLALTVIGLRHELLALYGPAFQRATTALVVLACAHLVNGCLGLTPWTLMVSGRSRVLLFANVGTAAMNVGLGLVLIPRVGLVGGAVAALITVGVFQLSLLAATWVLERVHPFDRRQVKPLLAGAATLAAQAWLPASGMVVVRVAAVLGCTLVVYGGTLLILGLPDEERRLLSRLRRS